MASRCASALQLKSTWPLHVMLIPGVILAIIFSYIPMTGISIAFQDFMPTKGFYGSPWIGLDHFRYILKLPDVLQVIYNTLLISILKIVLSLFTALVMALLVNELPWQPYQKASQSILLFPYFISWVVLGGIFVDIFSQTGVVNGFLGATLGIKPIFFLGHPQWFRMLLVGTNTWKEMGYTMVIFVAAMTSIDPTLYESARIDGATRWQQTVHITIPCITPMIVLLLTLALGGILNAGFDQVFVLYNALVYQTGDIIDTYVYRLGILNAQYSLATAVGLFKSLVGFILIAVSYWMAGKFANYRLF